LIDDIFSDFKVNNNEDLCKTRKVINLAGAVGILKVDTRQYWRVPEYHYVT